MDVVLPNDIQPLSVVDHFIEANRNFLERSDASDRFLPSGCRKPRTGGVQLVVTRSCGKREVTMRNDPFHWERIAEYEITAFLPSMAAEHLSTLVT